MSSLVDRLLLWACCAALVAAMGVFGPVGTPGSTYTDAAIVVAMLCALTATGLTGYLRSTRARLAVTLLYAAASALRPALCLFLPVAYYDAFELEQGWRVLLGTAAAAACLAQLPLGAAAAVAGLVAAAWALKSRAVQSERLKAELRQLRDTDQEMAMLLARKHKELVERQDYELRLATLNERSRIAREIHDHVGHLLSRSILQVGALMVTEQDRDARAALAVMRDTLSQAMDSIRASVHNLHDEAIDLRTQVDGLASDFLFCPIRVDYRLETEPGKDITYCFIAVIKEGLSNIIRHSDATAVNLTLLEHPALYQLVLHDNGSAGTGGGAGGEGLGLRNMEDRVAALGGQFLAERSGGFRLFVSVPKGARQRESASSRR